MTHEQDRTNNYLISLKEFSDKHPTIFPAFTAFLDREGNLYIHGSKVLTDSDVKRIAVNIFFSSPKEK